MSEMWDHHGLLLDMDWLLDHHRLRLDYDFRATSNNEDTSVALRPVAEVEAVDVQNVLHWTSTYMISQMEVISLLHNSVIEEHTVSASVADNGFSFALVRSEASPLSYVLHPPLEMNSETTLLSISFLMPVENEFKVGGVSRLHRRHIGYYVVSALVVVYNGHRVHVLVLQVRHFNSYCNRGRLYLDNWLLNHYRLHHRLRLFNHNDRLGLHHRSDNKHSSIPFSPVLELKVMDVEYMFKRASSNVVKQSKVVTFLHNTRAEEHLVAASMSNKLLLLSMVRSELDPFGNFVHSTH